MNPPKGHSSAGIAAEREMMIYVDTALNIFSFCLNNWIVIAEMISEKHQIGLIKRYLRSV